MEIFIYISDKIIFYGHDLGVYSAIETLLNLNIDPKRIIIVYPNEDNKRKFNRFNCFNNPFVTNVMNEAFADSGIKVYDQHYMKEWNNSKWEGGDKINKIVFERLKKQQDNHDVLEFECDVRVE